MKRTTTFTRGSGVYECRCCGRRTRDDGNGDSVHVRLCTDCFDLAGIENMITDGKPMTPALRAECLDLIANIKRLGGEPSFDHMDQLAA